MSTGDKRSVSTDALETLGTIIDSTAGRDAIHLAVEPVIADTKLYPGQDVGLIAPGRATNFSSKPLGIVDPFLKYPVMPGERFWLVLYPRQITSLRHVWTHPSFPEYQHTSADISASKDFIDRAANSIGVSTSDLMGELERYIDDRKSGGKDQHISFGKEIDCRELPVGFWHHYKVITGVKIPDEFREVYFQCAC